MTILLIIYILGGALLILLSIPLYFGKIPPNPLYGFRVPETLDTPELWYSVNRYAARWLICTGILFILGVFILFNLPGISVDAFAVGCLVVFSAVFITGLVFSFLYLKRVARH